MNEYDILNKEIGGVALKDMSSITFLGLVAKQLNGVKTYSAEGQSLIQAVSNPILGRMSLETKIDIMKKLDKLGIGL